MVAEGAKQVAPDGHDWRPDYPGRVPILGQYNDQETMDREILAASSHGVDFFQILCIPTAVRSTKDCERFWFHQRRTHEVHHRVVNHPPFD